MLVVLSARSLDFGNHYINHFSTAVDALIGPILTKFYLQTIGANSCRDHTRNMFIMRMRKHHHDFFVRTEI